VASAGAQASYGSGPSSRADEPPVGREAVYRSRGPWRGG
jgi:hypothetical protein